MKYVSNMDELFELTDKQYDEFLRLVGCGKYVHYALGKVKAKSLGTVLRVTDLEAWQAKQMRECP